MVHIAPVERVPEYQSTRVTFRYFIFHLQVHHFLYYILLYIIIYNIIIYTYKLLLSYCHFENRKCYFGTLVLYVILHIPQILSRSRQLKSTNVARKVKNHYFSIKYHELEKKVVPLQSHLPMTAVMSTEVYGAIGWRHYIIEGVTDALFLDNRTTTSKWGQKHCRGDSHGVCISDSVVCCEARVASTHT